MVSRFGEFTLDEERRVLSRATTVVHLTPKAFDLLVLLIGEAPRVVSKAELHSRLWPGTFVSDATLVGVMKEIRRALDVGDDTSIIRTVHRVGYAFAAPVERTTAVSRSAGWHWLVLSGRRYPLEPGENVVGRDPDAQVWIDAGGVSRRHASIQIDRGCARIVDLGSKNGTTLGGHPIESAAPLRDGDRVMFGSVPAVYRTSATGMSTETMSRTVPRQRNRGTSSSTP